VNIWAPKERTEYDFSPLNIEGLVGVQRRYNMMMTALTDWLDHPAALAIVKWGGLPWYVRWWEWLKG
jgi:hypothetical protein